MITAVPHSAVAQRSPSHSSRGRRERLSLTDDQLRRSVQERLSQFGSRVAGMVRVDVRHGEVVLRGAADSDYERRLIEQTVGRVSGIERIENLLQLPAAGPQDSSSENTGFVLPAFRRMLVWTGGTLIGVTAVLWALWQLAPQPDKRVSVSASSVLDGSGPGVRICTELGEVAATHGCCMAFHQHV